MSKIYTRYAQIIRVKDCDTVQANIDLGDNIWRIDWSIRIDNIDGPELYSFDILERQAAMKVTEFLKTRLKEGETYKFLSTQKSEKYGRAIGMLIDSANNDIGTTLLALGFAKCYKGEKKQPWTTVELQKILDTKIGVENV